MIGTIYNSLRRYLHAPAARSAEEFGESLEQEIAFHLAERTDEFITNGMSVEDARQAAIERFGDPSQVAAECHAAAVGGLAMWHWLHLATTAALVIAVGVLWFTSPRPTQGPLAAISPLPPAIASMMDNDWTGDVQGRILDERQQPIAAAHVLIVVKTWPDQSYFQRAYTAVTDAEGRFLVADVHPADEPYEVQIAAVADHRLMKSMYHSLEDGTLEPVIFELPASSGFTLQLEAEQGGLVSGVDVLVHARVDASGEEHLIYFDSAQSIMRTTDPKGRVELPYFQPGDTATLMLRLPDGDWTSREVEVPTSGQVATLRAPADSSHHSKDI